MEQNSMSPNPSSVISNCLATDSCAFLSLSFFLVCKVKTLVITPSTHQKHVS